MLSEDNKVLDIDDAVAANGPAGPPLTDTLTTYGQDLIKQAISY